METCTRIPNTFPSNFWKRFGQALLQQNTQLFHAQQVAFLQILVTMGHEPYHWGFQKHDFFGAQRENKMKPTNPNAHTYVNGTDVKTHGYAVTHNTFLQ